MSLPKKRRAVLMSRCGSFSAPFIAGAKLVMAEPEAHRDPLAMQQFFAEYGVTTTHFVPSMLAAFVASLTPETASPELRDLETGFFVAVKPYRPIYAANGNS